MQRPPSARYAEWFAIRAISRAPLLLILSLGSAGIFYGVIPRTAAFSFIASVCLWAFTMGAACHAVLWETRPTLRECLEVSLRAFLQTSGLLFIIMVVMFIGFVFLILPGLVALIALSLVIPLVMRERPPFFTALIASPQLIVRYWTVSLVMVGFSFIALIVTMIIALMASGLLNEGETANDLLFEALFSGFWSVSSAVLGSVCLLAIREVDEAGTRH